MGKSVLKKSLCMTGIILCMLWILPFSAVQAGDWVEIRSDDQTLFITPGNWRITNWNPSSSSVISVSTPIQKDGKIIGYSAETREPWRFVLQQYMAAGWRNPGFFDQRLMAYFIPTDGSVHAVILTHVLYGGNDGKSIIGVKGTCRSPRNGTSYTVGFER